MLNNKEKMIKITVILAKILLKIKILAEKIITRKGRLIFRTKKIVFRETACKLYE